MKTKISSSTKAMTAVVAILFLVTILGGIPACLGSAWVYAVAEISALAVVICRNIVDCRGHSSWGMIAVLLVADIWLTGTCVYAAYNLFML